MTWALNLLLPAFVVAVEGGKGCRRGKGCAGTENERYANRETALMSVCVSMRMNTLSFSARAVLRTSVWLMNTFVLLLTACGLH